MKIDKEKLKALSVKSDAELWDIITGIATKHGYTLPKNPPEKAQMEKIRAIMGNAEQMNMRDALRILQEYKRRT